MSMQIGTSNKVLAMPSMVQLVTKPISPLKGGTCLEIKPLPIQTLIIHILVTNVVNQLVKGSDKSDKKQDEHVNPTYFILDNRL
jgi:hypothetical protein